jgi:ABC-type phosphate transport system substrate-binding protein
MSLSIQDASAFEIIRNKESLKGIDHYSLVRIFTKRTQRWGDTGGKIVVFSRNLESLEHRNFVTSVLGMTHYRFMKHLKRQVYSGRSSNIQVVQTDSQMVDMVSNTPNSIGYLVDIGKVIINSTDGISIQDLVGGGF